jgi:hypothetical protein
LLIATPSQSKSKTLSPHFVVASNSSATFFQRTSDANAHLQSVFGLRENLNDLAFDQIQLFSVAS